MRGPLLERMPPFEKKDIASEELPNGLAEDPLLNDAPATQTNANVQENSEAVRPWKRCILNYKILHLLVALA